MKPANPGSSGKMAVKRETDIHTVLSNTCPSSATVGWVTCVHQAYKNPTPAIPKSSLVEYNITCSIPEKKLIG